MMVALVVAGLNTAISLVYYLRVVKTVCMDPESDSRGPVSLGFLPVAYVLVVSLPVLIFGLLPDWRKLFGADLFVYNRTYIAKSLGEMGAPRIDMKTVLQIVAALLLIFMMSVIFHKLTMDIMALAQEHSGQDFWRALGRYLIDNLAGG